MPMHAGGACDKSHVVRLGLLCTLPAALGHSVQGLEQAFFSSQDEDVARVESTVYSLVQAQQRSRETQDQLDELVRKLRAESHVRTIH